MSAKGLDTGVRQTGLPPIEPARDDAAGVTAGTEATPAASRPRRGDGAPARWVRHTRTHQTIAIVTALALWHLLAQTEVARVGQIPTPLATFSGLVSLMTTAGAGYWGAIWDTVYAVLMAVGMAFAVAVPVGLLIGSSERAMVSTRLLIDAIQTIPPIALLPLAMLLFGPRVEMAIALAFLGAARTLLIQSIYAAHQIDPLASQAARSFRLSRWHQVIYLWAPSVALFILTGLRIAATVSLLTVVAAQLLGGAPGIGRSMVHALQMQQAAEVFAWVLTAGALGVALNAGLIRLQTWLLWWHPAVRGGAR